MREETLRRVHHPDPLRIPGMRHTRTLIVDPAVDPIANGDTLLGWEGDARLGLYVCIPEQRFELYRFEWNGTYRLALWEDATACRIGDVVPRFVAALLAHDTRRGYDVAADVNAHNAARQAQVDAAAAEHTAEAMLRLRHALRKEDL